MAKRRRHPPIAFLLNDVLRKKRVSKQWLADRSGIPYPMICRMTRGDANPTWTTVVRIAWALGVPVSDFEPRKAPEG